MVSPRQALSRWSCIAAILALFGLAGALTRAATSDLTLLAYLLPIGLTLYNLGPAAACVACPPAAFAWLTLHKSSPFPPWPSPWAILGLSLLLCLLTLLVNRQHRRSRHTRDQLREISSLLPLCPNCGQLLGHDGQWRSREQLLLNPRLNGALAHHPCSAVSPLIDSPECP